MSPAQGDRTVVGRVASWLVSSNVSGERQSMDIAPDRATRGPSSTARAASHAEDLAALNRQIRLDLSSPRSKPGYRLLLLAVLPVVVAIVVFAATRPTEPASGAPSSAAGRLGRVYQLTERALRQDQSIAQQLDGASPATSP